VIHFGTWQVQNYGRGGGNLSPFTTGFRILFLRSRALTPLCMGTE
jgi:hypothetical protein